MPGQRPNRSAEGTSEGAKHEATEPQLGPCQKYGDKKYGKTRGQKYGDEKYGKNTGTDGMFIKIIQLVNNHLRQPRSAFSVEHWIPRRSRIYGRVTVLLDFSKHLVDGTSRKFHAGRGTDHIQFGS
jgi:hypothetical protein